LATGHKTVQSALGSARAAFRTVIRSTAAEPVLDNALCRGSRATRARWGGSPTELGKFLELISFGVFASGAGHGGTAGPTDLRPRHVWMLSRSESCTSHNAPASDLEGKGKIIASYEGRAHWKEIPVPRGCELGNWELSGRVRCGSRTIRIKMKQGRCAGEACFQLVRNSRRPNKVGAWGSNAAATGIHERRNGGTMLCEPHCAIFWAWSYPDSPRPRSVAMPGVIGEKGGQGIGPKEGRSGLARADGR